MPASLVDPSAPVFATRWIVAMQAGDGVAIRKVSGLGRPSTTLTTLLYALPRSVFLVIVVMRARRIVLLK